MDKQSSQEGPQQEKKPAPPVPAPSVVAKPPTQAPRPAPALLAPAPKAAPPRDSGRRTFVKALFAVGAILSIIPFVPWGTFLSSTASGGSGKKYLLQKVVIDNLPDRYGAAAGQAVNVKTQYMSLFPPNSHWVITYPSSGDLTLDAQNPDTFQKYELIRLPQSLGGSNQKATDFVAFSKVCVHLWCSPNYNPGSGHQQYECPCHGSIYRVPDGKAVEGPASLQAPPTNAIPMLTLQADSAGNLYVFYPNRDPTKQYPNDQVGDTEANGLLGYGRDYLSYVNFIKPKGELPADPNNLTKEVA
ncbi:MAG: Rieske 2Fe-2S domain-containing protein [Thaumarchaeota archaeon]|nr:Rieske 2Fe-2S domain-containing protein [Nitrososphaerota archaeon]